MKVKEIIKIACDFTNNQELKTAITNQTIDKDMQLLIDSFVSCFNLVNNEIASEFVYSYKKEIVEPKSLKIEFSSLQKYPVKIISVKDMAGRKVKYKVFDNHLVSISNKIELTYAYLPENLPFEGDFESVIPERVFAYGIAREFFIMRGEYDEADIWEQRFKNSLYILLHKQSASILPRRRWL